MNEVRILVTGGRDYRDETHLNAALDQLMQHLDQGVGPFEKRGASPGAEVILIVGGARGADSLAAAWGRRNPRVIVVTEKADWTKHGKAAGPIRNQAMLDLHHPELVVAFAGGRGTADMISKAQRASVRVIWARPATQVPGPGERPRRAPQED